MRLLREVRRGGAAALAAASLPAWCACQLQAFDLPVHMVGSRPVATVGLNGTEFPMLVDSGAFFSALPESTAVQLNLPLRMLDRRPEGYTGRIAAHRTQVDKVSLNGAVFSHVDFLVGGNELGPGVMGVLGRNFLAMADTEYDLGRGVVRLVFPKGECWDSNMAYWAGQAPVVVAPLVTSADGSDEAPIVEVRVNGRKANALMDTGAPWTAISKKAALASGIAESALAPAGRVGGAGAGQVDRWAATVDTFELGGEKVRRSRLFVDDVEDRHRDMVLGLDYFLSHRIYVSRLQDKVYLTWNGGTIFNGNPVEEASAAAYAAPPAAPPEDDADALARHGQAAAARGDFAQALADLDRACALAPQKPAYFLARARVHLGLRQRDRAQQDLDLALRLDFDLHEARALRARQRVRAGERDAALADLQALDGALPPSSQLREDVAQLYAELDLVPQALRQWDLWMPSHRNDTAMARALNGRCWLRMRLKIDLPDALADCKASVDQDDGNASAHDSLGWTYLRLGDAVRAIRAFDRALAIHAGLAFSLYGRGMAHALAGDADAAARDIAGARGLRPRIDEEVARQGLDVAPARP